MKTRNIRSASALALGAAAGALLLGLAAPASAHNVVTSTTPAEGETLTSLPAAFSITTNDQLLDLGAGNAAFAMQVTDADGRFYGDGCIEVAGTAMSMGATLGEPGQYTLAYQLVSADSHTISGEFAFAWEPADAAEISPGSPTPPVCGEAVAPEPSQAPTETQPPVETPDAEATPAPAEADAGVPVVLLVVGGVALVVVVGIVIYALTRRKKS